MPTSSQRLRNKYPMCIFCGGQTRAQTEEHCPGKNLFREGKWPQGYVVPACRACNEETRLSELLLAFALRWHVPNSSVDLVELETNLRNVIRRFPGIGNELLLDNSEAKSILFKAGRPWQLDEQSNHRVIRIPERYPDGWYTYGFKLGTSLHWLLTGLGRILAPTDSCRVTLYSSIDARIAGLSDAMFSAMMDKWTSPRWNSTPLDDQFIYDHGLHDGGDLGVYRIRLRKGITFVSAVVHNPELAAALKKLYTRPGRWFSPFVRPVEVAPVHGEDNA